MSKLAPRYFIAIAVHSICQPGNPSPHGLCQRIICSGSARFHNAKSSGLPISARASKRVPSCSSSTLRPESFPYSGNDETSKYTDPLTSYAFPFFINCSTAAICSGTCPAALGIISGLILCSPSISSI